MEWSVTFFLRLPLINTHNCEVVHCSTLQEALQTPPPPPSTQRLLLLSFQVEKSTYIARLQAGWLAGWLTYLLGPIMKWSQKICNLKLSSKIFGHCHLDPNFPPVQRYFFQRVLENTQFEFIQQNIWTLPIISEFPPGSKDAIENSFRPFSIGLQRFFKWSQKIRNLSLSSKIFVHCCLVANFHLVPEILSKIQFNSLNWATGFFSSNCLGKYAI